MLTFSNFQNTLTSFRQCLGTLKEKHGQNSTRRKFYIKNYYDSTMDKNCEVKIVTLVGQLKLEFLGN
jgi:hypothetical protein